MSSAGAIRDCDARSLGHAMVACDRQDDLGVA